MTVQPPASPDLTQFQPLVILSPVQARESTFLKLGQLQTRSIRLVPSLCGTSPAHDFGTTFVAQVSLHLTNCAEIVQLPLLPLVEDAFPQYSYTVRLDLRPGSGLMEHIMPSFDISSHHERVQADMIIYELIATASLPGGPTYESADGIAATRRAALAPVATASAVSLLSISTSSLKSRQATLDAERNAETVLTPRRIKANFNAVFSGPLSPGKQFVNKIGNSKIGKSVRSKVNKRHKRSASNPVHQLNVDTVSFEVGTSSWDATENKDLTLSRSLSIDLR